jgi:hypothetical protein
MTQLQSISPAIPKRVLDPSEADWTVQVCSVRHDTYRQSAGRDTNQEGSSFGAAEVVLPDHYFIGVALAVYLDNLCVLARFRTAAHARTLTTWAHSRDL